MVQAGHLASGDPHGCRRPDATTAADVVVVLAAAPHDTVEQNKQTPLLTSTLCIHQETPPIKATTRAQGVYFCFYSLQNWRLVKHSYHELKACQHKLLVASSWAMLFEDLSSDLKKKMSRMSKKVEDVDQKTTVLSDCQDANNA